MQNQELYQKLIEEIMKHLPPKTTPAKALAEILNMQKEAVYRRLRLEVPFTFHEVARITGALGISLDHLVESSEPDTCSMQLKVVEYANPLEVDYVVLEQFLGAIMQVKQDKDSHVCFSCSTLPMALYLNYEAITRFYLFKWVYMCGTSLETKRFDEIDISSRLRTLQTDVARESFGINESTFILDNMVLANLVNDIKFFASIGLLSPKDVAALKAEIALFIADLERYACKGHFDTGKKFNLFISNINFETCYTYCESENYHVSIVQAFVLNGLGTKNQRTFNMVKHWMQSLKRVSVQISESGEQNRIRYFNTQKEILKEL